MKIRDRARGRWIEILTSSKCGIDESLLDGRHHACPACGGTDRFRYTKDDTGGFFCADFRGDGFVLLQHVHGGDFAKAAQMVEEIIGKDDAWKPERHTQTYAERLQRDAKTTRRSRYLESRGLGLAPGLRFAKSVNYHDGNAVRRYAAMLAPVTRDGKFLTYHVTYLQDGAKAPEKPARKMLPGPSLSGASVALYPAAEIMGIAEGIETAIAARMLFGIPVWAALSTALMKSWEPPAVAKRVTIFADHDANAAGQAAAWHLCHRLRMKGVEADVNMPECPGDWNDVLLSKREAA
jgi:putative DNA primase/helicase